jgi:hypothetical protein
MTEAPSLNLAFTAAVAVCAVVPGVWYCRSTFSIPFSRSASFDDNLAFFKEVLAELQR